MTTPTTDGNSDRDVRASGDDPQAEQRQAQMWEQMSEQERSDLVRYGADHFHSTGAELDAADPDNDYTEFELNQWYADLEALDERHGGEHRAARIAADNYNPDDAIDAYYAALENEHSEVDVAAIAALDANPDAQSVKLTHEGEMLRAIRTGVGEYVIRMENELDDKELAALAFEYHENLAAAEADPVGRARAHTETTGDLAARDSLAHPSAAANTTSTGYSTAATDATPSTDDLARMRDRAAALLTSTLNGARPSSSVADPVAPNDGHHRTFAPHLDLDPGPDYDRDTDAEPGL